MCFESNERLAELVEVGGDLNILQPGLNFLFVGFTWITLSDLKHQVYASLQVSAAEWTSGSLVDTGFAFINMQTLRSLDPHNQFVYINCSHFHPPSTLAEADMEEWAASEKLPWRKDICVSENKRCCQKSTYPLRCRAHHHRFLQGERGSELLTEAFSSNLCPA